MSLEAQLRSPCGIGSAAKEELTRANVQEILNVITTQTANAKAYAFEDVEKYVSRNKIYLKKKKEINFRFSPRSTRYSKDKEEETNKKKISR